MSSGTVDEEGHFLPDGDDTVPFQWMAEEEMVMPLHQIIDLINSIPPDNIFYFLENGYLYSRDIRKGAMSKKCIGKFP